MTSFQEVLVAWQRDRDILVQRLDFAYGHVTNVAKVGVVAQNRPPCVSGVIFAVIEFSHLRLRQADFSEIINRTRMRPRYTWSAVSACSESRDRILKFGCGHFRCDVISGSIGCLATRPRYSCSAARLCIWSRDKRSKSGRGRSKSTSLCFRGDFCCNRIFTLETETSRFLGNYQSHENETAIYVVSGVCLLRIT